MSACSLALGSRAARRLPSLRRTMSGERRRRECLAKPAMQVVRARPAATSTRRAGPFEPAPQTAGTPAGLARVPPRRACASGLSAGWSPLASEARQRAPGTPWRSCGSIAGPDQTIARQPARHRQRGNARRGCPPARRAAVQQSGACAAKPTNRHTGAASGRCVATHVGRMRGRARVNVPNEPNSH